MDSKHKTKLLELFGSNIKFDEPLALYTSFGIGGPASALVKIQGETELVSLIKYLKQETISWQVIGKGTNLLVSDDGYSGVIIILDGDYKAISHEPKNDSQFVISVGAAVTNTRLCKYALEHSLAGCEFLLGIPGSLGGAAFMNAGAWGKEIAEIIISVTILYDGKVQLITIDDLHFSYRKFDSLVEKYKGAIIVSVQLLLDVDATENIMACQKDVLVKRQNAQKVKKPNAGSFFKNTLGSSTGKLIDECGLKGKRVGDAMVSLEHANFFVNMGQAKCADVILLMEIIQAEVLKKHNVNIYPEVHLI